jgi:heme/copper-type cytochrome/quinol oxidase subunit 2
MVPLAKFWTFVSQSFVPLAAAWIYFIRDGANEGALISRAYFGLLVTLLVATALIWSLALYMRAAKVKNLTLTIPPNTTFEDMENRNRLISYGTLVGIALVVAVALVAFGVRYSESRIRCHGEVRDRAVTPYPTSTKSSGTGAAARQAASTTVVRPLARGALVTASASRAGGSQD